MAGAIDLPAGMEADDMAQLLRVDAEAWLSDVEEFKQFTKKFDSIPSGLEKQVESLESSLRN